ncbi:MAG: hypothetical protein ACLSD6_07135 [Clostridium sp.]
MKKIGIAVMILAVIGVAVTAGVLSGGIQDDKVEQKRKDKKGRKSVCRQIPDEHIVTPITRFFPEWSCETKNATDDDLKSICVRNWATLFAGKQPEKESAQTEITSASRRTYFAD